MKDDGHSSRSAGERFSTGQKNDATCVNAGPRGTASASCGMATPTSFVSPSAGSQSPVVSSSFRASHSMRCSPAACPKTPNHEDVFTHRSFPSLLSVVSTGVPTLQHVPKAIRNSWAGVVMEVLSQIDSRPTDITAWTKFFMMAKCVLASPSQRGYHQWRNTLNTVRDRIKRWRAGDITGLWTEVVSQDIKLRKHGRRKVTPESQHADVIRRARQAVEQGCYRKAIQMLSSSGLAQANEEIREEMLVKHPQAPFPSFLLCLPLHPLGLESSLSSYP